MTIQPSNGWIGVGLTDVGRVRKVNQDAFSVHNNLQIWVLADGMGGHAGGEIASQIAVETIPKEVQSQFSSQPTRPLPPSAIGPILEGAIESANQAIREQASQNQAIQGMGTTIVVVAITPTPSGPQAIVAHAGDSRVYLFRKGTLLQWTKDHSLLEERLALGLITTDQMRKHPLRHVLTKALGIDPQAHPNVKTFALEPSDLILLCSDGLTKMLTDQEIQSLVGKEAPHLEKITQALITTANRLGGEDNTTVVMVGLDSDETWVGTPPA